MRPALISEPHPVLRGDGVLLRAPQPQDHAAWADLRLESRNELAPWEPLWSDDELSKHAWRQRIKRWYNDARNDTGYAFFVIEPAGAQLLGAITLGNVRRGAAQTATVGYWIGTRFTGCGIATAAVSCLARHAFEDLDLNRLEAACMPANAASLRVLEKAQFQREGLARKYLRIAGHWRDHVLLGRVRGDDWR